MLFAIFLLSTANTGISASVRHIQEQRRWDHRIEHDIMTKVGYLVLQEPQEGLDPPFLPSSNKMAFSELPRIDSRHNPMRGGTRHEAREPGAPAKKPKSAGRGQGETEAEQAVCADESQEDLFSMPRNRLLTQARVCPEVQLRRTDGISVILVFFVSTKSPACNQQKYTPPARPPASNAIS